MAALTACSSACLASSSRLSSSLQVCGATSGARKVQLSSRTRPQGLVIRAHSNSEKSGTSSVSSAVLAGLVAAAVSFNTTFGDVPQAMASQAVRLQDVAIEANLPGDVKDAIEKTSPGTKEAIEKRAEKVTSDQQVSFLATFPPTVVLLAVVLVGGSAAYLAQLFGPAKK
eukprot:jgi/Mesen1/3794/ME000206S02978